MSLDDKIKRGEQLAKKIDKIASQFDIAESSINDMDNYLKEKLPMEVTYETNPIELPTEIIESIIEISILKEDFNNIRTTLLSTVKNGRLILQSVADELLTSDSERQSEMISSFAELTNAVNQSLKLLSSIYKDIIFVQKEIINFNKIEEPKTINNTQNNFILSTAEIIKKLQNK